MKCGTRYTVIPYKRVLRYRLSGTVYTVPHNHNAYYGNRVNHIYGIPLTPCNSKRFPVTAKQDSHHSARPTCVSLEKFYHQHKFISIACRSVHCHDYQ